MIGCTNRNVLTIEPKGGLCNRMRSLDGAMALAADTGLALRVVWNLDETLGCPLEALFRTVPGVAQVDTRTGWRPQQYDLIWLRRHLPIPGSDAIFLPADVERMLASGQDFTALRQLHRPYIRTGKRVHRSYGPTHLFVLVPLLLAEVERLSRDLRDRVGVHIRHGDHKPGVRFSPTASFVARIEELVAADPSTRIFLATDDPDAEAILHSVFPGRILIRKKTRRDRGNRRAVKEAAIDLYCLARTKFILGTEASSFSRMAAELGGQPLEFVTSRTDETLEW